jgi:hypothetical protein
MSTRLYLSKNRLASFTLRACKSHGDRSIRLARPHERSAPIKVTHEAPVTPQNCAILSSICLFAKDLDLLDLDWGGEESDLDMNFEISPYEMMHLPLKSNIQSES